MQGISLLISHLEDQFNRLAHARGLQRATVGVRVEDRVAFTSATESDSEHDPFNEDTPVAAGCVTKILTATLVARAVAQGHVRFDSDLSSILPSIQVHGLVVRHLLNHTHGLDGSAVSQLPQGPGGRIDVCSLSNLATGAPPLAAPGEMYHYSSLGPWIAAAVLESIYGCTYTDLCLDLLSSLHIAAEYRAHRSTFDPTPAICPANGGALRLSTADLLRFVSHHMDGGPPTEQRTDCLAQMRADVFQPLGWHPSRKCICLGWNHYGLDWFGHNSKIGDGQSVVRFCPSEKAAIVIATSGNASPTSILAALFSEILPEFSGMKMPMLLTTDRSSDIDRRRVVGMYENAESSIIVELTPNGSLRATTRRKSANGAADPTFTRHHLRPASDGLFLPFPPDPFGIPWVQFLCPTDSLGYRYLYTGKRLLRNVALR